MATPVGPVPALSADEIHRYSRHLMLDEIGMEQLRLKAARVLCIGAGGLGSPATMYLAAAGVGTLGLVDFDTVEASNLQRQILYGTADVGALKTDAASRRLNALNPSLVVEKYQGRLSAANALYLIARYDMVLDGTDNFATRYLVNDACVMLRRPNVYGSIFRFEGQASVLATRNGPCYRCLYPEPPPPGLIPSCGEAGVLGVLPGVIGAIQATEAIKLITGAGEPLIGRFLIYDALRLRFRELKLQKDPDCPVCGRHPSITRLTDDDALCGARPAPDKESANMATAQDVTAVELKTMIDRGEVTLIDVREPTEYRICQIPGSTLIPLGELTKRVADIDQSRPVVIHCKSGGRSAQAVSWLRGQGFTDVRNMKGGILAWIADVDPSLPKY